MMETQVCTTGLFTIYTGQELPFNLTIHTYRQYRLLISQGGGQDLKQESEQKQSEIFKKKITERKLCKENSTKKNAEEKVAQGKLSIKLDEDT